MRHAIPHRSPGLRRALRVALALACALGAFQMAGCQVTQRLNTEMKEAVNAKLDEVFGDENLPTDQRLVSEAAVAIDRGEYLEAETLLESALQINPTSAAAKLNLAAVYEATDRQQKAAELYASLVRPAGDAPVAVEGDERLSDSDAARIASFRLERLRNPRWQQSARIAPEGEASTTWSLEAGRAARLSHQGSAANMSHVELTSSSEDEPTETKAAATGSDVVLKKPIEVTLATFKSEPAATSGSAALWIKHETLFGDLTPKITPVELGQGKGKAFRLSTGPFASAREAYEFCEKLQAQKVYCVIAG